MALRKDPARRYHSVEQLSEDLRRYLEGLPVVARKDTRPFDVVVRKLNFPPFGVARELAPEAAAATVQ